MAGEITMSKHNFQRAFSVTRALMALAALASIAGCDGGKAAKDADAARAVETGAGNAGAGASSQLVNASIAEVRHFEAYNRYRMMFDDAADHHSIHGHGNDIRPALAVHDGVLQGGSSQGCFATGGLNAD